MSEKRIVVVGAGLAGLRTAEELRLGGFDGNLILVGNENAPALRPAAAVEGSRARRNPRHHASSGRVLRREGHRTAARCRRGRGVDTEARTLRLADGSEIAYDELVIATGLVPAADPRTAGTGGRPRAAHHRRRARPARGTLRGTARPGGRRGLHRLRTRRELPRARRRRGAARAAADAAGRRARRARSARWWPGCTARRASTCGAVSGSIRCPATTGCAGPNSPTAPRSTSTLS